MTTAARPRPANSSPSLLVFHVRDRVRQLARAAFPRRRARLLLVKSADDATTALRTTLVDAALVDLGTLTEEGWRAASLAQEFPSVAFFGVAPLRAADGPTLGRCATMGFADVLVDGVDDDVTRELVMAASFSARFGAALHNPSPVLGLQHPLQQAAWRVVVSRGGRAVQTAEVAARLGVTREHLSRTFSSHGAPNLKRVIDLVRLIAAAELAKNPGYDIRDVAQVLEFASSSHLASTAQRIVGTKPASLARLRTVDLIERFMHGHDRSRSAS